MNEDHANVVIWHRTFTMESGLQFRQYNDLRRRSAPKVHAGSHPSSEFWNYRFTAAQSSAYTNEFPRLGSAVSELTDDIKAGLSRKLSTQRST